MPLLVLSTTTPVLNCGDGTAERKSDSCHSPHFYFWSARRMCKPSHVGFDILSAFLRVRQATGHGEKAPNCKSWGSALAAVTRSRIAAALLTGFGATPMYLLPTPVPLRNDTHEPETCTSTAKLRMRWPLLWSSRMTTRSMVDEAGS